MATPRRRSRPQRASGPVPGSRPTAITSIKETRSFYNWLIHGGTGAGKTVLGGTAPRALFISFEPEGTDSAKVHGSTAEKITVRKRDEMQELYDYFDIGTGCTDYDWVEIDSLSEMEECYWRDHLATMKARKPTTRSLFKPALDDYVPVWNMVKHEVDRFNRLGINVLYTAQSFPFEVEAEDGDSYMQQLPLMGSLKNGGLAIKVAGMVSLVGYLDVKSTEDDDGNIKQWRRLYTTKSTDHLAKNRYGWEKHVDNPTIPKLVSAADAALGGSTPTRPVRSTRTRTTTRKG